MAGILDSKSRILDTIITQEGRRQIASGKLRVQWVSFSDAGTFYEADAVSGSSDATARIYLEAASAPQDQITFEADDSGKLLPFTTANEFGTLSGRLLRSVSGSLKKYDEVFGSDSSFASMAGSLLDSSLQNMQNLYLVGTRNELFDDNQFLFNTNTIEFSITDNKPISRYGVKAPYIDSVTRIHEDVKLSHLPNFQFMPPLNKVGDNEPNKAEIKKRYNLGNYQQQSAWTAPLEYSELANELAYVENSGYCQTIKFDATSAANNLLAQFFEISYGEIKKLDVIDFGTHLTPDDENSQNKHVFFVGKVIKTDQGINSFIHLFTLVYE